MVALIESQADQIRALRRAVDTLEGRLTMRADLDVIVAHEVRTPLTVIHTALETLGLLDDDDPRRPGLLQKALDQSDHLREVVNELMKPQGHGPKAVGRRQLVSVPLDGLVERALSTVSIRIRRSAVSVDLPAGLMIETSPARLAAILVNLFENAARYGGGDVSCRAEDIDGVVVIEVADRGAGLRGRDPEPLFRPFVQGEGADRESGRGIGLYLVRMLARSLGGDATLADREGGGLVASVVLPQRRDSDRSRAEADEPSASAQ